MRLIIIIATVLLSSCATEVTPDQARDAADAARAWLEVVREARVIITDDK